MPTEPIIPPDDPEWTANGNLKSRRPIGYRPPRCPQSGMGAPLGAEVTESGGLRARCPDCDQVLWLNRYEPPGHPHGRRFTFPEHIGVEEPEAAEGIPARLHLHLQPEVPPIFVDP